MALRLCKILNGRSKTFSVRHNVCNECYKPISTSFFFFFFFVPKLVNNIYVLGEFTEKPYSKPFERNVVYIPIITLSHGWL